tara:strand:- start:753 stop:872 length:120 start_codon:yes stop_codon:yes gene_type:complete
MEKMVTLELQTQEVVEVEVLGIILDHQLFQMVVLVVQVS